jgi:hypothetical protein
LVKHLFKRHGAPQQASGYSNGANGDAKARPASSHSHTASEALAGATAPAEVPVSRAGAPVKA